MAKNDRDGKTEIHRIDNRFVHCAMYIVQRHWQCQWHVLYINFKCCNLKVQFPSLSAIRSLIVHCLYD